ncbi:MAG: hypothetical protein BroJett039_04270 [Chloroflexota bacterium]|nr:MAG: hypothetical protein BroJett039_04270 [Chloroflexota bacterium]
MNTPRSFGHWLKQQRRARGLTQREFGQRVYCAEITIRKIEADDLRPSKQLAHAFLQALDAPRAEQAELINLARRNHGAKATQ